MAQDLKGESPTHQSPQNWVFIGDSLTEGVGVRRTSYVSELTNLIRRNVLEHTLPVGLRANLIRLRPINPISQTQFAVYNLAGHLDKDHNGGDSAIWLWNLASEGKMIDSDQELLGFLSSISPSIIVIFRGGLESILRPRHFHDDTWPWWVPLSWCGYAAMDPAVILVLLGGED